MANSVKSLTIKGFVLGRAAFAKISAVEGVALTRDAQKMFADFDRQNLPADKRRAAIVAKHGAPSPTKKRGSAKR